MNKCESEIHIHLFYVVNVSVLCCSYCLICLRLIQFHCCQGGKWNKWKSTSYAHRWKQTFFEILQMIDLLISGSNMSKFCAIYVYLLQFLDYSFHALRCGRGYRPRYSALSVVQGEPMFVAGSVKFTCSFICFLLKHYIHWDTVIRWNLGLLLYWTEQTVFPIFC